MNFLREYGLNTLSILGSSYTRAGWGEYFEWQPNFLLEFGAAAWLWALAIPGLIWGLVKASKPTFLLLIGSGSLFLLAQTHVLGVPSLLTVRIVVIWFYLPIGLLGGYFLAECFRVVHARVPILRKYPRVGALLVSSMLLTACVFGVVSVSRITLPENGFVRAADLAAMDWIKAQTSSDALFYISTHFWTPATAHGLDAGYWIPYFTGRETILPPETYASDGSLPYRTEINERARHLTEAETIEALYAQLLKYGVTHIYIGVRPAKLDPNAFLASPDLFNNEYDRDGVTIFRVLEPTAVY
jgi:hypothetical protein